MTEEELLKGIDMCVHHGCPKNTIYEMVEKFLKENVVIPKCENRHQYADVWHKWLENTRLDIEGRCHKDMEWFKTCINTCEYRIKPSEPVWEFLVCMHFTDGTFELTNRYFTQEEFYNYGFPSSCELAYDTKRGRR